MKLQTVSPAFSLTFGKFVAFAAAGAIGLAAAGCGDDSAVGGPAVADQDTAAGSLDGSLSGSDGTAIDQDVLTGVDGSTLPDGAVAGTDATSIGSDAIQVSDATVVPQPGSCAGQCGIYDKKAACQCDDQCTANGDCCGDYKAQCGAVASTCGDGKCGAGETAANCPGDCAAPPGSCVGKCGAYDKNASCQCDTKCTANGDCCGDLATACPGSTGGNPGIVTCVETNCPTEVATCTADPACSKILDCAKNCADQNCLMGCVGGPGGMGNLPAGLQGIYTCGNKANCFATQPATPVCGDGKCDPGETNSSCPKDCPSVPPAPVCGDGQCNGGETAATCAKDCSGGTTTTTDQCIQSKCSTSYPKCAADPACLAGLACVEGGKQVWNCVTDWQVGVTLGQVQACAAQNGCMNATGGGGGGGTTPTGSCAGICGKVNTSGGFNACQCQTWCVQAGNCCSDYQALCVTGGGTTAKCGDGVCAAASGETATTCPADCGGTPPATACKTKSDCTGTDVCCAQASGNVCLPAANCK